MSMVQRVLDRLAGIPPRPDSKGRLVAVKADVYQAAQQKAQANGETVAQVVERALREYSTEE